MKKKNVLIAKSSGKAELEFNGVFEGMFVGEILLANKNIEEGKVYVVEFEDYEIVEGSMVMNALRMKEAK